VPGQSRGLREPCHVSSHAVGRRFRRLACDDNSGAFTIQFHPQSNPSNTSTFDESGPWSVVGNSDTGAYSTPSAYGVFGVVLPPTDQAGTETVIGFMQPD
jgi:hypothetical protein